MTDLQLASRRDWVFLQVSKLGAVLEFIADMGLTEDATAREKFRDRAGEVIDACRDIANDPRHPDEHRDRFRDLAKTLNESYAESMELDDEDDD
jgi:hypothetical protein